MKPALSNGMEATGITLEKDDKNKVYQFYPVIK